jgi:hypothetical protein
MKFALNHPYMFEKKGTAIMVAWANFLITYLVEQLNVFVILTSFHGIGLVGNFVAL